MSVAALSPGRLVPLFYVVEGFVQAKENFGRSLEKRLCFRVGNFAGVLAGVDGDVVEHLLEPGDVLKRT